MRMVSVITWEVKKGRGDSHYIAILLLILYIFKDSPDANGRLSKGVSWGNGSEGGCFERGRNRHDTLKNIK